MIDLIMLPDLGKQTHPAIQAIHSINYNRHLHIPECLIVQPCLRIIFHFLDKHLNGPVCFRDAASVVWYLGQQLVISLVPFIIVILNPNLLEK